MVQAIHSSLTCCSQTVYWDPAYVRPLAPIPEDWLRQYTAYSQGTNMKHWTTVKEQENTPEVTGLKPMKSQLKTRKKQHWKWALGWRLGHMGDREEGSAIGCNRLYTRPVLRSPLVCLSIWSKEGTTWIQMLALSFHQLCVLDQMAQPLWARFSHW